MVQFKICFNYENDTKIKEEIDCDESQAKRSKTESALSIIISDIKNTKDWPWYV